MDISKYKEFTENLTKKLEKATEKAVKNGLMLSFRDVVEKTPVADDVFEHPGWLRNNWQIKYTDSASPIPYGGKVAIESTVSRIESEMKDISFGKDFYFVNPLDYAYGVEYLEWSPGKAPQGMMGLGIKHTGSRIKKELKKELGKIK